MIDPHEAVLGTLLWILLVGLHGSWLVWGLAPMRLPRSLRSGRVLLVLSVLIHVAMLVSIDAGWFDPLGMEPAWNGPGHDFGAVHAAGRAILDGGSPYDRSYGHSTPFRYLPMPALVFAMSFSHLEFKSAYWLWAFCNEIGLLVFLRWILTVYPHRPSRWAAVGGVLASYPLYGQLHAGQFDLAMGFAMMGMAIAESRRRRGVAFALWVASVLTKLYSWALVIPLVLRRRWRWCAAGTVVVVVLSLPWMFEFTGHGSVPVTGLEQFTKNFRQADGLWLGNFGARHLIWLVTRRLVELTSADTVAVQVARVVGLSYAAALVTRSTVDSYLRRHDRDLGTELLQWALTFLLVAGDVWVFSSMSVLPWLAWRMVSDSSRRLAWAFALLCLPSGWIFVSLTHPTAYGMDYQMSAFAEVSFRLTQAIGLGLAYAWVRHADAPE